MLDARRPRAGVAAAALVLGLSACGSDDGSSSTTTVTVATTVTRTVTVGAQPTGPLSTRQLARAVVDVCRDEVDARERDHAPEFLPALVRSDRATVEKATDYNVRALGRVRRALEALTAAEPAPLEKIVTAVRNREAGWRERQRVLRDDGGRYFTGKRADAIRLLRIARPTTNGWASALDDIGVRDQECGKAVP